MTKRWHKTVVALLASVTFILALGCAETKGREKSAAGVPTARAAEKPKFMGPKKRIAVMEFENKTDYGKGKLGNAAADMMMTALVKSGAFEVMEREQLNKILNEQGMGMSGGITSASAVQAGRMLGLQAMVVGSVTEFGTSNENFAFGGIAVGSKKVKAVVDCRLIDTETGKILMVETASGSASQGQFGLTDEKGRNLVKAGSEEFNSTMVGDVLRGAVNDLVGKIKANLASVPWKGEILKAEGGSVIIKGGTDVGLKEGDEFEVIGKGEEMEDSSGNKIVLPGSKKGEVQAVNVFENATKVIVKSGTGFEKGDTIILKPKAEETKTP